MIPETAAIAAASSLSESARAAQPASAAAAQIATADVVQAVLSVFTGLLAIFRPTSFTCKFPLVPGRVPEQDRTLIAQVKENIPFLLSLS